MTKKPLPFTEAEIEQSQSRLASILGPDPDQARIDEFNKPSRFAICADGECFALEDRKTGERISYHRTYSAASTAKKWAQNRSRWDAWKKENKK